MSWNIPNPPNPTNYNEYASTPTPKVNIFGSERPMLIGRRTTSALPGLAPLISELTETYGYLTVNRYWKSVFRATLVPGGTRTYSVETGVESSTSSTRTFGVEIGLEAGFEIEGLSAKINTTISMTSSTTETVTVDSRTTVTDTVVCPAGLSECSFDIWQLWEEYSLSTYQKVTQMAAGKPVKSWQTNVQKGPVLQNPLNQIIYTTYPAAGNVAHSVRTIGGAKAA